MDVDEEWRIGFPGPVQVEFEHLFADAGVFDVRLRLRGSGRGDEKKK